MEPIQELKIEYSRLRRHVNYLEKRYSAAVARDLAANLRNWKDMASLIDELSENHDWKLRFTKETLSKKNKQIRAGSSIAVPLPGSAYSNNMQISGVVTHNRVLSPEGVKASYEAGLSARPTPQEMSFTDWLNNSVYQVRVNSDNRDIPRGVFIDRVANLLGGTHPMSNFVESEHATWADPYVVELLTMQVGQWPAPYAILMESAQEILKVFGQFLNKK